MNLAEWMDEAACKGKATKLWFAVATGNQYKPKSARRQEVDVYDYARKICGGCPVRVECAAYALDLAEQGVTLVGLWGGLDEGERTAILRRRRRRSA